LSNSTNISSFGFSAYYRLSPDVAGDDVQPTLRCSRDIDKFTVNEENGNGDLDYPIGMLTADEVVLAGEYRYTVTYLDATSTEAAYTLTPLQWGKYSLLFAISMGNGTRGIESSSGVSTSVSEHIYYLRHVISISNLAKITGGTGLATDPFIIG